MEREDAKDLTLSILVLVAVALAADCIWLHIKCSRLDERVEALVEQVDRLLVPPPAAKEQSFADKAKQVYEKAKNAAVKGYEAARGELQK